MIIVVVCLLMAFVCFVTSLFCVGSKHDHKLMVLSYVFLFIGVGFGIHDEVVYKRYKKQHCAYAGQDSRGGAVYNCRGAISFEDYKKTLEK